MVRLTDRPDMTLDVYRGRKTTTKQTKKPFAIEGRMWDVTVLSSDHCYIGIGTCNRIIILSYPPF